MSHPTPTSKASLPNNAVTVHRRSRQCRYSVPTPPPAAVLSRLTPRRQPLPQRAHPLAQVDQFGHVDAARPCFVIRAACVPEFRIQPLVSLSPRILSTVTGHWPIVPLLRCYPARRCHASSCRRSASTRSASSRNSTRPAPRSCAAASRWRASASAACTTSRSFRRSPVPATHPSYYRHRTASAQKSQ